jgi:hypothetical protein
MRIELPPGFELKSFSDEICDYGGYGQESLYRDQPNTYVPQCQGAPSVRYRTPSMVEGYWGRRCSQHAELLSAPDMVIEKLGAQS